MIYYEFFGKGFDSFRKIRTKIWDHKRKQNIMLRVSIKSIAHVYENQNKGFHLKCI